MRRRRLKRIIGVSVLTALLVAVGFWFGCPPPLEEAKSYPSGMILRDSQGRLLRVGLGKHDMDCRPYYRSSPDDWIVKATIAAEDRRFYSHHGVDFAALFRAAFQDLASMRILSGASTITMQCVRLIHRRKRTWWSKLVETVQALRLERAMGKEEILDQYFNRAPFGSNLVGVEAAAWGWFGKDPKALHLGEAAMLAGLLQSPTRFRPDRHPFEAKKRRAYVLERMERLGMIDAAARERAERVPLVIKRAPRPFREPYFCDWVLRRHANRSGDWTTTLDAAIQEQLHACLARQARRHEVDFAGVVLDVKRGAVVALDSTGDYFSRRAGQVNGAVSPRPAGSTLKPFVVAMALDGGTVEPLSLLADVPKTFGNHAPKNFSNRFIGPVSVRDSLILSLNLPMIELERRVGQAAFYARLKRLGLRSLNRPAADYGLGLVLGNGSVSLVDLVNAYACLARGGVWKPCSGLPQDDQSQTVGERLFSEAAAWLVADMLGGEARMADAIGHIAEVRLPRFAWKTGTSSGYRDAWTVAWNPEYVIGIWAGFKSGHRTAGRLVGKQIAAPVAWEMVRLLYPDGSGPWFKRPETVVEREVCAVSGAVPARCCPVRVKDWAIDHCTTHALCTLHEEDETGTVQLRWPPDLEQYFRGKSGQPAGEGQGDAGIRITSPSSGSVFRIVEGIDQQIAFKVEGPDWQLPVSWFCDDCFDRTLPANEAYFWAPQPGRHRFTCATADGASDTVEVTVERP
ncbi:MAG: penicillin-binding protein 1C [Kiritimatiellae bacterium]|nr:penicillin-binding protein 1C [Kiritimatiellia bacterium]